MSLSIQCPHCTAQLNIKDPALLGKKLRCPKCKEVFRAPDAPPTEPAFASLDFNDSRPSEHDWSALPELNVEPSAPTQAWAPPVREVPASQANSKTAASSLSSEELASKKAAHEFSLLMVAGSICGAIALVLLIVGSVQVWRSIQKNSDKASAAASSTTSNDATTTTTGGNLPTVFGFDEPRRTLLVDYLISHGCGKPKAKLTMAMMVNSLKKLAADFDIEPTPEFPEKLALQRERIVTRDVPEELLKSDKMPAVFESLISEYQERKLGPAEEEVAILVIIAYLGAEM